MTDPTYDAFCRAVRADPRDETTRLTFADYCDDTGRAEQAALLRMSVGRRPWQLRPRSGGNYAWWEYPGELSPDPSDLSLALFAAMAASRSSDGWLRRSEGERFVQYRSEAEAWAALAEAVCRGTEDPRPLVAQTPGGMAEPPGAGGGVVE